MALMEKLFLGIGAMKAGTTWLYSLLERHHQIQFTPEKEIHFLAAHYLDPAFLSDDHRQQRSITRLNHIDQLKPERQEKIRSWYHDQYLNQELSLKWYQNLFEPTSTKHVWNADFSNLSALIDASGWARLRAEINADIRAIYILREPCERLWSQFKFSQKINAELDEPDLIDHTRAFLSSHQVEQHSSYCKNLDAVRGGLGDEQVKIVFFDAIAKQPEQLLASIETFLQISSKDHASHPNLHRAINTTAAKTPPPSFRKLCAPIVERELHGLRERGINVPSAWMRNNRETI